MGRPLSVHRILRRLSAPVMSLQVLSGMNVGSSLVMMRLVLLVVVVVVVVFVGVGSLRRGCGGWVHRCDYVIDVVALSLTCCCVFLGLGVIIVFFVCSLSSMGDEL